MEISPTPVAGRGVGAQLCAVAPSPVQRGSALWLHPTTGATGPTRVSADPALLMCGEVLMLFSGVVRVPRRRWRRKM